MRITHPILRKTLGVIGKLAEEGWLRGKEVLPWVFLLIIYVLLLFIFAGKVFFVPLLIISGCVLFMIWLLAVWIKNFGAGDIIAIGKFIVITIMLILVIAVVTSGVKWVFDLDDNYALDMSVSVNKCLKAIEERDWNEYVAAFEPSAVLHQTNPGVPVYFEHNQYNVIQKSNISGIIDVRTVAKIDSADYPLHIKLIMVKVNRGGFLGSFGLKKWYIAENESQVLPFGLSYGFLLNSAVGNPP